jgi:hypothetical protein
MVHEPPSILTHQESSFAVGHKTRANTLYVPLWLTLNAKLICPAVFVGALAVLLLPGWMTTYDELEAFASAGLFHKDPAEAHSASSQVDVDCALATAVNNVTRTIAGRIVRWKTETEVFMAPPGF